jgi:hypothetical protein
MWLAPSRSTHAHPRWSDRIHLRVLQTISCIWGTTRRVPRWCFFGRLGLILVVKYRVRNLQQSSRTAVLEGDNVKFIQEPAECLGSPPTLGPLLTFYSSAAITNRQYSVRLAI